MGMCGRWCGIRKWTLPNSQAEKNRCQPFFAARGVSYDILLFSPSALSLLIIELIEECSCRR
jgi:hypothetical protein